MCAVRSYIQYSKVKAVALNAQSESTGSFYFGGLVKALILGTHTRSQLFLETTAIVNTKFLKDVEETVCRLRPTPQRQSSSSHAHAWMQTIPHVNVCSAAVCPAHVLLVTQRKSHYTCTSPPNRREGRKTVLHEAHRKWVGDMCMCCVLVRACFTV